MTAEETARSSHGAEERAPAGEADRGTAVDAQRLLRMVSVTHEVLVEVRSMKATDAGAIERLRELRVRILAQLREALTEELYTELVSVSPEVRGSTLPEATLAHAEVLGWLEGLFQGTELAIQLEAARALQKQLQAALPDGKRPKPPPKEEGAYL